MTSKNGDNVLILHETTAVAASVMVLMSLAAVRGASDEKGARRRLDAEIVRHITDFVRALAIAARAWAVRP